MLMIVLAWIAVVIAVDVAVMRPWKSPAARAPLPLILAVAMAAWVLISGAYGYRDAMADGLWTAASITIGFVPIQAILYSLLAYAAGSTFMTARKAQGPLLQRWSLTVGLSVLTLYLVASGVFGQYQAGLEKHAGNPNLTTEQVAVLVQRIKAGDASRGETGEFLGNPLCPPELLTEYAANNEPYLRRAVARNQKIDAAVAEKLAADPNDEVRYFLSFNRDLPVPVLSRLAADSSENVRAMVAWTKALPDEDFNKLVNDPSAEVRATVAIQTRLSPEALEKLRADPEQRVRDAANRWQSN